MAFCQGVDASKPASVKTQSTVIGQSLAEKVLAIIKLQQKYRNEEQ
jgi:hypothetical protein